MTLLGPHGVAPEPAVAIGLLWLASQVLVGLVGGVLFLLDRRAVSGTSTVAVNSASVSRIPATDLASSIVPSRHMVTASSQAT